MMGVTESTECNEMYTLGRNTDVICKLHKGHCSDHLAIIYWKQDEKIK